MKVLRMFLALSVLLLGAAPYAAADGRPAGAQHIKRVRTTPMAGCPIYGGTRTEAVVPVFNPGADGAYGFFGGEAGERSAIRHGIEANQVPFMGLQTTPMTTYSALRNLAARLSYQQLASGPQTPTTTLATDLEARLAARNIALAGVLGTVVGSVRLTNGDICTYGTLATLHLASDNSGSLTFNDGEVLTFPQASPCLRQIALQSTLIF